MPGFPLIETIVVIVILTLLATFVAPNVFRLASVTPRRPVHTFS